ncbi:hypothetical protein FH972_015011 [Carpinus fangiana]|uniref:Uncharacterized protein n=1 Tax=Carpinus fangiana TaxID=176857 RepID=A0A5N6RCH4_9ROSI|nr:hypothetical protein FH972_015011 [Carpinus fangiana]
MALFFNPGKREELYGPLLEITSAKKPAIYRQFTLIDFMTRFFGKELDGKSISCETVVTKWYE